MARFAFSILTWSTLAWSTLGLSTHARSTVSNSTLALSTPPYAIAANATLSEFQINIPDEDLENLNAHLQLFRAPHATFENSQVGWSLGVPKDWLVGAVDYWLNEFDWRKQETVLNSVPQFKLSLEDDDGESYTIHFAALFSENKDAIPIILSHGWPALYCATPDLFPYHLIVPSSIGTGFSSAPPLTKPFYTEDNARIWNKLMIALGFGKGGYIAQGTDIGAMISEYMLETFEECKAAHVTLWWGNPPFNATKDLPANSIEEYALARVAETQLWGNANVLVHSDRSSTAALSIGSSPISLLTWLAERLVLWSNPSSILTMDQILTNVAMYWFTGTYPTSYWVYAAFRNVPITLQNATALNTTRPTPDETPYYSNKSLGYSWFPNDVGSIPKSYFDEYSDIFTNFYEHDEGGHFMATEQPDALWADIEDFVLKAWKN